MTKESYKLRRMIVIRQSLIIVGCVSGQSYRGNNLSLPLAVNLSPIGTGVTTMSSQVSRFHFNLCLLVGGEGGGGGGGGV